MVTGSRFGRARIQAGSYVSRAATGQAAALGPAARGTARALPLPRSVNGHPDSMHIQAGGQW